MEKRVENYESASQAFSRSKFSSRFRALRKDLFMSQEEFAKYLGISRPTVGFYENADAENGRIPDAATIFLIAKKCNVSADYLLGLSDTETLDADVQAACKATGLTGRAYDRLSFLSQNTNGMGSSTNGAIHILEIVNELLESAYFMAIAAQIALYKKYVMEDKENKADLSAEVSKIADDAKEHGYILTSSYRISRLHRADAIDMFSNLIRKIAGDTEEKKYAIGEETHHQNWEDLL